MGVGAYLSLTGNRREVGWGGRLFEAGRLLTFSAFRMGANSRLGAYSNKYGIRETNCTIHWIEIYPLDSAIHLLNHWGLVH